MWRPYYGVSDVRQSFWDNEVSGALALLAISVFLLTLAWWCDVIIDW